jgi:propanol-preferring alcohol dehydrogenase
VGGARDRAPAPLDSAIVFAPAGDLVPVALESLEAGGTLALAGIHVTAIPSLDYRRHLFRERSVCSVTSNTRRDGEEFLTLAARLRIAPVTEVFPLEAADDALAAVAAGDVHGAAVLRV